MSRRRKDPMARYAPDPSAPAWEMISSAARVSSFSRTCDNCGQEIPAGSPHTKLVGLEHGRWRMVVTHAEAIDCPVRRLRRPR